MKIKQIALLIMLSSFAAFPAYANPDTEEMMRMIIELKKRVEELEDQLAQQSQRVEQVETMAKEEKSESPDAGNIEFHGLVEVEATSGEDQTGTDGSDITLATVELGVDFSVFNNWVSGSVVALYEDNDTDDLEIDQAFITIGNTEEYPLYLSAGRMYVPFGNFETNLISDPLTLEIGETREDAIHFGFEKSGWYGSAYVFNGDMDETGDDEIENYGSNFGYKIEHEDASFDVGVSWVNSIGDSDGLEDTVTGPLEDYVAAYGLHAVYRNGPWSFIGEVISATENFQAAELPWKSRGAEPSAYNLEVGYDFEAFAGRESNVAFSIQGTDESVALELPEKKLLAGFNIEIYKYTVLAFEFAHAEDYSINDGGTGKDGNAVTLQLAVEF